MDDLISRRAAINEFYKYPNIHWTTLDVMATIDELPSAQPEPCGDMINKEYLKEHIEACWTNGRPRYAPELNELLSWIDDVPSAPSERKRGEWKEITDRTMDCCYRCSECGFIRDAYFLEVTNFCPNCGADMREGEKE